MAGYLVTMLEDEHAHASQSPKAMSELVEKSAAYADELRRAGRLKDSGRLRPSKEGKRVHRKAARHQFLRNQVNSLLVAHEVGQFLRHLDRSIGPRSFDRRGPRNHLADSIEGTLKHLRIPRHIDGLPRFDVSLVEASGERHGL